MQLESGMKSQKPPRLLLRWFFPHWGHTGYFWRVWCFNLQTAFLCFPSRTLFTQLWRMCPGSIMCYQLAGERGPLPSSKQESTTDPFSCVMCFRHLEPTHVDTHISFLSQRNTENRSNFAKYTKEYTHTHTYVYEHTDFGMRWTRSNLTYYLCDVWQGINLQCLPFFTDKIT